MYKIKKYIKIKRIRGKEQLNTKFIKINYLQLKEKKINNSL